MYLDWTKHLKDEQEIKNFKEGYQRNKWLLERLSEVLNEYEKSLSRTETNSNCFDIPNWYERQIFNNGYRSCLNKIQELIKS
jgi:arginine/lysine/ornithine decarboxylase